MGDGEVAAVDRTSNLPQAGDPVEGAAPRQDTPIGCQPSDNTLTLLSLETSLQDNSVDRNERMGDVIEWLARATHCVGVIVLEGGELVGVISRDLLARQLARPFYRELCERRPVSEFLRLCPQSRLELPLDAGISLAVEAALDRPIHERYEPVVVRASDGRRLLLDVPVLLTAQCQALNAALTALEAQRAATLAVERQRHQLHEQLIVASRQAGRAEVATGVLHNVGNVLNSVNVSASVIGRALEQSKLPGLSRAVALLRDNSENLAPFFMDDARGKRLPGYLEKLSDALSAEQNSVVGELRSLAQGLDHIKQVVQMQQSYARDHAVIVPVNPAELVEDALRVNLVSFERHSIAIERDFAEMSDVLLDKHRVLQILINLISNAKNAVKSKNGRDKVIRVNTEFDEAAQQVRFTVKDNGIGIAPETLARIFAHGFTTRSDGHGFGLHSSANAAREMNGALTASSDGLGQGATFILDLPVGTLEVAR